MDKSKSNLKKYILFAVLAVISYFSAELLRYYVISEYFHIGLDGPNQLGFIILVYFIFFAAGLYISKERSFGFAVKAFAISFITIMLIFAGIFTYSAYSHYNAKYISAQKLQTAPEEFVILTQDDLEKYPEMKTAISSGTGLKVKPDKWSEIIEFLDEKGSHYVKVDDEYYHFLFATA